MSRRSRSLAGGGRLAIAAALGAVTITLAGAAASATTPPGSTPPASPPPASAPPASTADPAATVAPATTAAPAPFAITSDSVRHAKIGWAEFVAAHYATPTSVPAACPSILAEQLAAALAANGLTPTARPHVVTLTRDQVGAGIVNLSCGVDLSKGADPSGSIDAVVEVTLLDGQADYPAYVLRVGGRDTPIEASPLGGVEFVRCRTEPSRCIGSWYFDGMVVTVRLELQRNDENALATRAIMQALVPQAVAGLATYSTSTVE